MDAPAGRRRPGGERARWPAHARGVVDFGLTDPLAEWNTGTWRLAVADGAAALTRIDGEADLRLDVRGFALLYAGAARARSVAEAGLLRTAGAAPDALDLLGVGGPAQLLDYF
ncbi:sterol carrier protein domain-containing protein [Micromonospora sp. M12]